MATAVSLLYNPMGNRQNGNVIDEEAARAYNIKFGKLIEPATHKVFYVNLGNKPMTLRGLNTMLKYLESTIGPDVKILDVSNLSIEEGGRNNKLKAFGLISKAMRSSKVLQVLNLSGNNLGSDEIDKLEALLTKKTLERINVSNCALTVQDAQDLCDTLRARQITHLSMGNNPTAAEDNGQVIASFVGKCTRLSVIELSSLAPGRAGTRTIVKALHKLVAENHTPLEWVSLSGFDFGDVNDYEELKATLGHDNLHSLTHVNVMNSGIERLPSEEQDDFIDLLHFKNSGLDEDNILIGNDNDGDSDEQESQFVELSMII